MSDIAVHPPYAPPTVLFSTEIIAERVGSLAAEIAATSSANLLVVGIFKGSFIFAADLLRALHAVGLDPEVDFLFLSSYGEATRSRGRVKILRDIDTDVHGREVLLVDDILESGRTLLFARSLLAARGAARVATCVLLDKEGMRDCAIEADYRGFPCPPAFVVGYGMDLAHRYRQLPFIGAFEVDAGAGETAPPKRKAAAKAKPAPKRKTAATPKPKAAPKPTPATKAAAAPSGQKRRIKRSK